MANNYVGKTIKEKRIEKGYSQKQFAEIIEKSVRTLQKYESGEIETPLQVLSNIAEKLDAPIENFIGSDNANLELKTLSDFISILFSLEQKKDVHFEIKEIISEKGNVSYNISFDTYDANNPLNHTISDFLMEYKYFLDVLETGKMPTEIFESWQEKTLITAKNIPFKNKPPKTTTYAQTQEKFMEEVEDNK